jgi:hypothetical protein
MLFLSVVRKNVKLVSQNSFSNSSYFEEAGIVHNFAGYFPLVTKKYQNYGFTQANQY